MAPGKSAQNKQLALQAMKRKKMYEQQRNQILGTQFNVDALAGQQRNQILGTQFNVDALA